jgi:AcrR family transcriptional regulator
MADRAPSAPRKQQERTAESARRLLAATVELIAEKGFDKTTAEEIGERAGYSRGMVWHRYGSKEHLLESLMDEYKRRLLRTPTGERSGIDEALAQIDLIREMAAENPELLRAFYVLCFEAVGPLPNLGPWMKEWLTDYRTLVAKALRVGQTDRSVREDLHPETEARRFVMYGSGLAFSWILDPESTDFKAELADWREHLHADWRIR